MSQAIAAYNFVPLPEEIEPGQKPPIRDRYHAGRYTGHFNVRLTTITPTYTRAAKAYGDRVPPPPATGPLSPLNDQPVDFFHWGDTVPVLPGSSLRGMFRSVFEIVTCSRLDFVSKRRLFYRFFAAKTATGLAALYSSNFQTDRLVAGILMRCEHDSARWCLRVSNEPTDDGKSGPGRGFLLVDVQDSQLGNIAPMGSASPLTNVLYTGQQHKGRAIYEAHRFAFQRKKTASGADAAAAVLRPPHEMRLHIGTPCAVPATTPPALTGWLVIPGSDVGNRRHWYQAVLESKHTSGVAPTYRDYPLDEDVYRDYELWGEHAHGSKFRGRTTAVPRNPQESVPRHLREGGPGFALLTNTNPPWTETNLSGAKVSVIGANMMLALRYEHGISDLIREQGGQEPDMAQAVFGHVANKKDERPETIRGRIFIEDARLLSAPDNVYWMDQNPDASEQANVRASVKVPDVLAGPKPTSVQTYLEQSSAGALNHYGTPGAMLRGSKRYWHRPEEAAVAALNNNLGTESSQRTKIRPVRAGVTFETRVRFENLTAEELGALYASIQLPQKLKHQFGMGKNLGMGALDLEITETTLWDMSARLRSFDRAAYRQSGTDSILCIAYNAFARKVYPGKTTLWRDEGIDGSPDWKGQRMAALAALLSRDPQIPPDSTRQIGVDGIQWKNRDRLTRAHDFMTGFHPTFTPPGDVCPITSVSWAFEQRLDSEATRSISAALPGPPGRHDVQSVDPETPLSHVTTPETLAKIRQVDSRLKILNGPKDTVQAEQLVEILANIPVSLERDACASRLWMWIEKNVKKDKHAEKDWYCRARKLADPESAMP